MIKVSACAVLSSVLLSGCAGYKIVPPQEREVDNVTIVNKSHDQVWSEVINWYAENNAPIDKLDKESGLITSYSVVPPAGSLDCGKIDGNWSASISIPKAKFNTVVMSADAGTKVKFNLFGEAVASQIQPGGSKMETTVRCVSTGRLESVFSDAISM